MHAIFLRIIAHVYDDKRIEDVKVCLYGILLVISLQLSSLLFYQSDVFYYLNLKLWFASVFC